MSSYAPDFESHHLYRVDMISEGETYYVIPIPSRSNKEQRPAAFCNQPANWLELLGLAVRIASTATALSSLLVVISRPTGTQQLLDSLLNFFWHTHTVHQ